MTTEVSLCRALEDGIILGSKQTTINSSSAKEVCKVFVYLKLCFLIH